MKKKFVVTFVGLTILLGVFSSSNIFAESKKALEEIVMEHDTRINALEQKVNVSQGALSPEVKQDLVKEVGNAIKNAPTKQWDGHQTIQLSIESYDIQEEKGKVTLKIFTSGNYNWTETKDSYGNEGIGRTFARNFIWNFDPIAKMYGVNNLYYEFYQNDVQIKSFSAN
ncbi:hypothetical protein [Ectobacillus sp. sgz5001026]|uniref:hypothetical protein n=1 Tax=Ectobacillus sp. sgz5001026 TaxID=3242473 RepID=UPI0036D2A5A9